MGQGGYGDVRDRSLVETDDDWDDDDDDDDEDLTNNVNDGLKSEEEARGKMEGGRSGRPIRL